MLNFRGRSDHIGSAAFLYRAMVTLALRWPLLALAAAEWQRTGSPCQCFPCGTNATSAQVWTDGAECPPATEWCSATFGNPAQPGCYSTAAFACHCFAEEEAPPPCPEFDGCTRTGCCEGARSSLLNRQAKCDMNMHWPRAQ